MDFQVLVVILKTCPYLETVDFPGSAATSCRSFHLLETGCDRCDVLCLVLDDVSVYKSQNLTYLTELF